jgi:prepilin-type N-terminal cleavage/methylation domain-containing protein
MTLIEVMAVLAMIGVLVSMAAPSLRRSMEQTRADMAGGNLRAIWAAQRVHWLEYRTYAENLADLVSEELVDPTLLSGGGQYVYAIPSADSTTFTATATRTGSGQWSGQFTIDQTGVVSGTVQADSQPTITPGFL